MVDYTKHTKVLELLTEAQDVERDNRERSREAHAFLDERDGQWEQDVIARSSDSPRYTFDLTSPIVEQIAGEIEQADFGIKVSPSGSKSTKEDAQLFAGLIRGIENNSGATDIYASAARKMVVGGIGGWRIVQKFVDGDSFDQDLVIEAIDDFTNRVWFDPSAKEQTKSDSRYCFVINPLSKDEAEERWPDKSIASVSDTKSNTDWGFRADDVFIGQIYYKVQEKRELVRMSDGSIHEDNDEFKQIVDDLAAQDPPVTEERRRTRSVDVIKSRLFDANSWLIDAEDTVFRHWIPVVPIYGNYKIDCNKTLYRGVVEKAMDAQRVFNYSETRTVAETALAPRQKLWMTIKQALGFESTLATLNTNHDPVQFYNVDEKAPGIPGQTGGAAINPGLASVSQSMRALIGQSAGVFAANMGDNPGLQSGVAIERLQNKGDTGTVSYFKSVEKGIGHTGKIIKDAAPRVYDTPREVAIENEDRSPDTAFLNEQKFDQETKKMVTVNDLSKGRFDVVCSAGPSFQNRQQEAVAGIIEVATIFPGILEMGADTLLGSMQFPASQLLSERFRAQLFDRGQIPIDQMTDDEKELLNQSIQANQQKGPSPEEMIGQAELITAQNEQAKTQISVQEKGANITLAQQKQQIELMKARAAAARDQQDANLDRAKFAQSTEAQRFDQMIAIQEQQADRQDAMFSAIVDMATAMKTMQDAAAGPVQGPGHVENVATQSSIVSDTQSALTGV